MSVRPTVYRAGFMGERVEEDSLEGIMVGFNLQEGPSSRMEVIKCSDLVWVSIMQDIVASMLSFNVSTLLKRKTVCEAMEACMKLLFTQNWRLLAEDLQLWQIDSSLLTSPLPHLEESAIANIARNLSGQYTFLANSIR